MERTCREGRLRTLDLFRTEREREKRGKFFSFDIYREMNGVDKSV
jgi:hypothetical protein